MHSVHLIPTRSMSLTTSAIASRKVVALAMNNAQVRHNQDLAVFDKMHALAVRRQEMLEREMQYKYELQKREMEQEFARENHAMQLAIQQATGHERIEIARQGKHKAYAETAAKAIPAIGTLGAGALAYWAGKESATKGAIAACSALSGVVPGAAGSALGTAASVLTGPVGWAVGGAVAAGTLLTQTETGRDILDGCGNVAGAAYDGVCSAASSIVDGVGNVCGSICDGISSLFD